MSDTPRTDKLARGNHVVPTEWAEDLERECSAAIHALEMIAYDCNNPRADYQAVADAALMDIENMRGELK